MEDLDFEIPELPDKDLLDIDVDKEWEMCAANVGINTKKGKVLKLNSLLKIAAAVVLTAGVSWFIINNDNNNEQTFASAETLTEATVENSTLISINKNSKIVCSQKKGEFNVKLQGEAYFDVEKNPARKFKISAGEATIVVHGTSFNVCQNVEKTVVSVNTGEVEVINNQTGESQKITRGQQIVCSGNTLQKTLNTANCMAWKSKKFEFNNSPISDVMDDLSKVYGFKYTFADNGLKGYKLSSTFENQDINAIFHIMQETLDVEISLQENGVYIIKNK